jgi:cob(I)alamin adenosyltransferase
MFLLNTRLLYLRFLFSDSDLFTISAVKGENISISSNQREAHLNIVNPCAVCFFESPIMRGETLCFSIEPIVRDGKVAHNFSFKVAIAEINPEEFLPVKPYLYDITFLPVSYFEKSFKKVQGEIAFQYTTEGVASVQYKTNKSILQNITFEKSYLLLELCKVKLKYLYKRNDDPAIPTGVGIPDVTATTTDEFESVYDNSKIQLDLIRREVGNLSIYSNENNESIYDDLLPRGSEAEYDQWKQNDLHQAVEGVYKRLESIEERLCNNTGSKVASLQQTDTSSLESDIKEIRRMLERLSGEPVKLREKVNVQISPPISEEDERSVLEVIQPNVTEFVPDNLGISDVMYTATTTNESESVYANSKIQLDLIRREVDNLSLYSNENNESIYDDLLPRGSEAEYDQWKQNDLHQAVEGIYKRLESIEERLCNNTGSKVASLQQTDTSSLESDIKEIRRMLESLSGEPVKLREKVNVQISPPISEEDERSVLEVIRPNFTEFVQLLDTVPFMDRMFEKLHLTLEEYERIRILSQTNRVEANRDLSMIIFRRQSVDLAIFKQCLIETKQDGVLGKLFPKK